MNISAKTQYVNRNRLYFTVGVGLQRGYFEGPFDCLTAIYRVQGISGVYRGALIMSMRDIPALSIYILSYELLYNESVNRSKPLTKKMDCLYSLTAGGISGVVSWIITMPLDTIKSKIQSQAATQNRISISTCIYETYRSMGLSGLFRGISIASIRAFPVNGVTFMVYSQILHYLDNRSAILFEETVNA